MPRSRARLYRSRARIQRRERSPRHRRWRSDSGGPRHVPRRCSAAIPNADGRRVHPAARLWSICGTANRARTDGGDGIGSGRAAAVRYDSGHSRQQSNQRARYPEHPRRAFGHVQRRSSTAIRRRARCRRARPPCARSSGSSPMRSSAPRSSTRSTGSNPDLTAMPMYCIPFSFKDPFDTKDMRSTGGCGRSLRHRLPGARPYARRSAPPQGRHHLRQGGQHRVQRHPPATQAGGTSPTKMLVVRPRAISAAAGQATRATRTTRRARRRSARARGRARRSAPTS